MVVDRSLLNKLTMENFESISNQIIQWANRRENDPLCRKMMEQISPDVQDEDFATLRENRSLAVSSKGVRCRCCHDITATAVNANEVQALKVESEKEENKESGETPQFSEEYYALFKLQMLTECIMHECIKKLSSSLLSTVGQPLGTSKARGHMDVYFSRMKKLAKGSNVCLVCSSCYWCRLLSLCRLRRRRFLRRNSLVR
ncbi:ARM repeat-containing protein [Phellopilus nigrolimitatus]|nr:ARM repeat-containing protein [Phellopilus nigrolimitatus]